MEKIIKPIVGLVLIGWLTYIGLGILFKGGETVVNRMEDRAIKSREEAKAKDCERAKLNYQNYPSEKTKLALDKVCT